jgi:hypothetical protein
MLCVSAFQNKVIRKKKDDSIIKKRDAMHGVSTCNFQDILFSLYFEFNLNSYIPMKFDNSFIITNFFNLIFR